MWRLILRGIQVHGDDVRTVRHAERIVPVPMDDDAVGEHGVTARVDRTPLDEVIEREPPELVRREEELERVREPLGAVSLEERARERRERVGGIRCDPDERRECLVRRDVRRETCDELLEWPEPGTLRRELRGEPLERVNVRLAERGAAVPVAPRAHLVR